MKNGKFKCPICGSTHFEHIISKTTPDWFGIRCYKCIKYLGWLKKELYNSWRNGLIDMDEIKPSRDTTIYLRILKFFKDRGFKQINYHTLSNDDYVINLDEQTVINKNTNEKIDLKSFIKTLKG